MPRVLRGAFLSRWVGRRAQPFKVRCTAAKQEGDPRSGGTIRSHHDGNGSNCSVWRQAGASLNDCRLHNAINPISFLAASSILLNVVRDGLHGPLRPAMCESSSSIIRGATVPALMTLTTTLLAPLHLLSACSTLDRLRAAMFNQLSESMMSKREEKDEASSFSI